MLTIQFGPVCLIQNEKALLNHRLPENHDRNPKVQTCLVGGAGHFPATLCAFLTGRYAFIHVAYFLATRRACFTDFCADFAEKMLKMRASQLKICRGLAYLGTIQHEAKMFCFNMLSTGIEAMIHGGLKTNLMAMAASLYAGLHDMFGVGCLIHGMFLN